MTASFEVDGTNVTVIFQYTTTVVKATATVDAAAEWLGRIKQVDFDSLNQQQKLDLLDDWLLASIRGMAKAQVTKDEDVNRDAAVVAELEEHM